MKLMFHKENFNGKWFDDDEFDEAYTEKVPPHAGVVFDENIDEWILNEQIQEPIQEEGPEGE